MTRVAKASILIGLLLATSPLLSSAQGPSNHPYIGKRVITIPRKTQTDAEIGGDKDRGHDFAVSDKDWDASRVYRVERADGARLWLVAEEGGESGWAPAANVIPLDEAADRISTWIRAKPASAALRDWRGVVWQINGDLDKALVDYTEAIRLDPACVTAWSNRGQAWADKADYDKAIADFNQAIRLAPKIAI